MTKTRLSITSAMLITLSLPPAQAADKMAGCVTVADLARETLAKKTLQRVQASSVAVADQADQLRRVANSMLSLDWQLDKLSALKGEVNRMGQEIGTLRAERESLAPWEQQAVDEVLPLLQATAANTESAIEYFNENRHRLWMETYRGYADRVWQGSDQIAKILKNYLKCDRLLDQEIYVEERIRADSQRNTDWGLARSEGEGQHSNALTWQSTRSLIASSRRRLQSWRRREKLVSARLSSVRSVSPFTNAW